MRFAGAWGWSRSCLCSAGIAQDELVLQDSKLETLRSHKRAMMSSVNYKNSLP